MLGRTMKAGRVEAKALAAWSRSGFRRRGKAAGFWCPQGNGKRWLRQGLRSASAACLALASALLLPVRPSFAGVPDVVVYGDPTLAFALRDVGALFEARTGAKSYVFSAPPELMVAQLHRQVQNDVIVTGAPWMDRLEQAGLLQTATRAGAWRNRLLIARRSIAPAGDGVFAYPDATPASTIDGPAVLSMLGLHPSRAQGVANDREVAFLLQTGVAERGLLHLTELKANPFLVQEAAVADTAYAPILYTGALTRMSGSPNAKMFLDTLLSPEGAARLRADGLEVLP